MKNVYINLKEQNNAFVWNWLEKRHKKDLISVDDLIGDIEELVCDVETLEEKLEDTIQDRNDNYKRLTDKELYE